MLRPVVRRLGAARTRLQNLGHTDYEANRAWSTLASPDFSVWGSQSGSGTVDWFSGMQPKGFVSTATASTRASTTGAASTPSLPIWHRGSTRGFRTSAPTLVQDYYSVLGVSKGSSGSDIKKAYYKLAKQYHPDTNAGDPAAEKKFQEVQKAYETLSDSSKREMYDQVGAERYEQAAATGGGDPSQGFGGFGGAGFGGMHSEQVDMEDILNAFFGGGGPQRQRRRTRGEDLQVQVSISMQEAFAGGSKSVHLPGAKGNKGRSIDLMVPAGVDTGNTIRLDHEGLPAKDLPNGHLYVQFRVAPDRTFQRDDSDVHMEVQLPIDLAALGGSVSVPTLAGDVDMKVKAGIQGGHRLKLSGRGFPRLRGHGSGDQIVHVVVKTPTNLSARQKELLQEFAEEEERKKKGAKAKAA